MRPIIRQIAYKVPKQYRRPNCRGLVFKVNADIGRGTPGKILEALEVPVDDWEKAGEILVDLIEVHASKLVLFPAVAPVAPGAEEGDDEFPDLLTAVTVIAKSSDKVFIKSKRPLLSRLRKNRNIVLLIPKTGGER